MITITTQLGNREIEITELKKYEFDDAENICIHFDSNLTDSKASERMVFITIAEAKQIVSFLNEQINPKPIEKNGWIDISKELPPIGLEVIISCGYAPYNGCHFGGQKAKLIDEKTLISGRNIILMSPENKETFELYTEFWAYNNGQKLPNLCNHPNCCMNRNTSN